VRYFRQKYTKWHIKTSNRAKTSLYDHNLEEKMRCIASAAAIQLADHTRKFNNLKKLALTVGAVTAIGVAAIAAAQMISLGEDHVGAFEVEFARTRRLIFGLSALGLVGFWR
jgi:hypothetical protein